MKLELGHCLLSLAERLETWKQEIHLCPKVNKRLPPKASN